MNARKIGNVKNKNEPTKPLVTPFGMRSND